MFYKYKVNYYNPFDDTEPTDTGIVYAVDFGAAANKVQIAYGRDNINDIFLHEIPSDDDYCLNKEEIDFQFKEEGSDSN